MNRLVTMLLAGVLVLCAPAFGQRVDEETKQAVTDELGQILARRAYVGGVTFGEWPRHLEHHRDEIDAARTAPRFARALNEALSEFGISHVRVMVAGEDSAPTPSGLGIAARPAPGGLRVLGIDAGSAASGAAIGAGDIITSVNGAKPEGPEALAGPEGQEVTLKVRRLNGEVVELKLTRGKAAPGPSTPADGPSRKGRNEDEPPAAKLRLVGDNIGLIRIDSFSAYDEDEVASFFEQAMECNGLIIDVRGNGGGRLSNLQHLLSFLLIEGTPIGVAVSNELAARYVEETGGDPSDVQAVAAWSTTKIRVPPNPIRPFPGRVAVLVDDNSGSASEMCAAALSELKNAAIVGRTSAGALLVSRYMDLPGPFKVQVPVSDYVTIKGFRPEGKGVEPDVKTPRPRRGRDGDSDVSTAADLLRGL